MSSANTPSETPSSTAPCSVGASSPSTASSLELLDFLLIFDYVIMLVCFRRRIAGFSSNFCRSYLLLNYYAIVHLFSVVTLSLFVELFAVELLWCCF
ncbi:uncharacterized protein DS421_19g653040 [Arachis hypogaea]|uniref:Uncharacterized protein n=1 Tax=Arachis hypogaea TaxID=3818 RepID=A0A6B9V7S5_ARAHY|nr:uncharacterized protein DS421_19g653040 [Arachis hypogaea]